ncbi:hypothetical protein ACU686_22175 [Yinghuangia aomiensis]
MIRSLRRPARIAAAAAAVAGLLATASACSTSDDAVSGKPAAPAAGPAEGGRHRCGSASTGRSPRSTRPIRRWSASRCCCSPTRCSTR